MVRVPWKHAPTPNSLFMLGLEATKLWALFIKAATCVARFVCGSTLASFHRSTLASQASGSAGGVILPKSSSVELDNACQNREENHISLQYQYIIIYHINIYSTYIDTVCTSATHQNFTFVGSRCKHLWVCLWSEWFIFYNHPSKDSLMERSVWIDQNSVVHDLRRPRFSPKNTVRKRATEWSTRGCSLPRVWVAIVTDTQSRFTPGQT